MAEKSMTERERFLAVMEYKPVDRVPNHEAGVWGQTIDRWEQEGLDIHNLNWDWFTGEAYYGMDAREFMRVNFEMLPLFEEEVLEENDRFKIARNGLGVVTRALLEGSSHGTRASMDEFISFPVKNIQDFRELKKRFNPYHTGRYSPQWKKINLPRWKNREHVLIMGVNCSTKGFYWRAREWMGTEAVSFAWYDQPALMDEMMEFIADFTIEVAKPILAEIDADYVMLSEDLAMKNGPLLSPKTFKRFIFPHMRRLIDFLKKNGVRYVMVDTDGNPEPIIPLFLEAGVDGLWPLERAADQDPLWLRKKYGRALRLTGAVDKRELAEDLPAIDAHLRTLIPLIEEGGFIPTVDHTVPPDVPLKNFEYYMEKKKLLLEGKL